MARSKKLTAGVSSLDSSRIDELLTMELPNGDSGTTTKRKPGRPKKAKPVVEEDDEVNGDDDDEDLLDDLPSPADVVMPAKRKLITIPQLVKATCKLRLIGDRPLLINNKMNVAEEVAERYGPQGKSASVKAPAASYDEQYARAFYVMPSSRFPAPNPKGLYGIPASGIRKCAAKGARPAGITDNTTIGLINNSFSIMADEGGLCRLYFKELVRDIRAVNIGSGQKTVPQMRHRPMFRGWHVDVTVMYNPKVLSPEQIVNLFMHAGQFIGLHEMRAEKKQGECGGFVVESVPE